MKIEGIRIDYGLLDSTIAQDTIVGNSSEDTIYSDTRAVFENNEKVELTYLEEDYFLLDGTFIFPEEGRAYNVGWESENISDANGNTTDYIEYVFGFTHSSYGVQLRFPDDSVVEDFDVEYYGEDGTQLDVVSVRNNTQSYYSNFYYVSGWKKIRIQFLKVKPRQRARLYYVLFGTSLSLTEDDIMSISASRKVDFTSGYNELGDINFTFFNDGKFDIKSISDIAVGLQEGLKVQLYTKANGVYIPYGEYVSESTVVQEDGIVVGVNGYSKMYSLNNSTYRRGVVFNKASGGRSLGDWARDVAGDCGILIGEGLYIDESFDSIISYGYITEVPHREAFRLIAEAGNGYVEVDKQGKVFLKKLSTNDNVAHSFTYDDIVENTLLSEESEKTYSVEVVSYDYYKSVEQDGSEKILEVGRADGVALTTTPQHVEIVYSTYPVDVNSIAEGGIRTQVPATITNLSVYSDRVVFDISGEEGVETWIVVLGVPYNTSSSILKKGTAESNVKKIENNFLISSNLVDAVAEYQYGRLVGKYSHTAEVVTDDISSIGEIASLPDNVEIIISETSISVEPDNIVEQIKGVEK